MMAGQACSTRIGARFRLLSRPHTRVPEYTSFVSILWRVVFVHDLPLALSAGKIKQLLNTFIADGLPRVDRQNLKQPGTVASIFKVAF